MDIKANPCSAAIISGNINTINGVNRFTNTLIDSSPIFSKHLVELIGVYANNEFVKFDDKNKTGDFVTRPQNYRKKIRNILKKSFVVKNYYIQRMLTEKTLIDEPSNALKNYFNSKHRVDCLLLQGVFAAIAFERLRPSLKRAITEKIIVISHTTEDPLEQLLMGRKEIAGTMYEKQLRREMLNAIKNVDSIVVLCETAKRYFLNQFNLKTTLIYNGISDVIIEGKRNNEENRVSIGTLGSVTKVKGIDLLVEAISLLSEEDKRRIIIYIAGEGNLMETVKIKTKQLEMNELFVFLGNISNVVDYLCGLDLLVQPSRMDTQPLSVIEAMRSAIPVLATRVGGLSELIDEGCNGILVNPSIDSIADGIRKFINLTNQERESYGENSRLKYLNNFSLESTVMEYSKLIHRCCM